MTLGWSRGLICRDGGAIARQLRRQKGFGSGTHECEGERQDTRTQVNSSIAISTSREIGEDGQLSQAVSSAVSEMDGDDLRENDNVGQ
jgi:hypothetical protein